MKLSDIVITKIKEILCYKTQCCCGYKNLADDPKDYCPVCNKNLKDVMFREIKEDKNDQKISN